MNAKELREAAIEITNHGNELALMADHILATVRDDDDEPITPLWLSQWGECLVDCRKIGILCIDLYDGNWSVIGEFGEVYIKPQEKRGQFRSLCRGLGIELKEGGK